MRPRRSLAALPLVAGAMVLANGCGGDDEGTTPAAGTTAPSGGGQTVNVSETDYALDPSDPTVQPGIVSFEVTNDGGVAHNLEVEGPKGEVELEQDLAPGESSTLTVDLSRPGHYEFYCPVGDHRDRGMEGEVTVAGGGVASGGGADTSGGGADTTGAGGGSGYGY